MTDELFYSIIDQLGKILYAGRISPIWYGEPLMDRRIVKFVKYIRNNVSFCEIWLNTNGDLLTEQRLIELIDSGVSKMYVTNYDDKENEILRELSQKYASVIVYKSIEEKRIFNRAGALFERESEKKMEPCNRPSGQLVINWDGEVLLCCNDYYAKYSFGNLKEVPLLQAWYNPKFQEFRDILKKKGGRQKVDICRQCDI